MIQPGSSPTVLAPQSKRKRGPSIRMMAAGAATRYRKTLLRVLPLVLLAAVCNVAAADPKRNQTCAKSEVDCGYFGCFPPGSECPQDCDTHKTAESCRTVLTADKRQACVFNPQYSEGKGLCQKNVQCYNLPYGECSLDCFRCHYYGCLPSGTNCPRYCEEFDSASKCETLGGVAGGFACQWDKIGGKCGHVPLSQLNRRLDPTPILAHAALSISNGVTITPSDFPVESLTPIRTPAPSPEPKPTSEAGEFLDWAGAQGSPGRVALYVGFSFAALGLISVLALLMHRRARKAERDRALAAPLPPQEDSDSDLSEYSDSEDREEPEGRQREEEDAPARQPRTLFNRESLIVHIRRAVGDLGLGQQFHQHQESPPQDSGQEKRRRSAESADNRPYSTDRTPGSSPQLSHEIPPTILARKLSTVTSIDLDAPH